MSTKNVSSAELRRMTPKELRQEIAMHRTEYAKMRMGVEMQKEKNHALYKSKRREIARMKTIETAMAKNPSKPENAEKTATESKQLPSQAKKKPVKVSRSK